MNENAIELSGRIAVGLGICAAVGVACHSTKSGLPLLGLVFLPSLSTAATRIAKEVVETVEEEEEEVEV